jgi:hypothetical protein
MTALPCDEPGCSYVLDDERRRLGATGLHRRTDGGDTCAGSGRLAQRDESTNAAVKQEVEPRRAA